MSTRGKKIVSLIMVFMMVMTVFAAVGPYTSYAASDPYVVERTATSECPISKVEYVPVGNDSYSIKVTIDYRVFDSQDVMQTDSVAYSAFSAKNNAYITYAATSFDYEDIGDTYTFENFLGSGKYVKAGETFRLYYALCSDGFGEEPLTWYDWQPFELTAPEFDTTEGQCYTYVQTPTKGTPVSKAVFVKNPNGTFNLNMTVDCSVYDGQELQCANSYQLTIRTDTNHLLNLSAGSFDGYNLNADKTITFQNVFSQGVALPGEEVRISFALCEDGIGEVTADWANWARFDIKAPSYNGFAHTPGKYVLDNAATTSKDGAKHSNCTKCNAIVENVKISKIKSINLSATEYTYNGKKKTPSVTVTDSKGNKLTKDTDYTVKYSSTSRKKIGRYYATVTFKGNYSGSKKIYFTIGPKNPSSVKTVLYGYDDVKVSWSKVSGASGYVVYYKKASASSYTKLKTTTSTSYKKSNLSDGVKYDFKVVAYKTVSGNKCYNAGKTSSITTLKKVTGVKAAKSSSKVKVSWTNIGGETGYQISKSTSKSKTNVVATYKTTSGKSKTISATKGKTYYYKVRAYKSVDGKRIYGPWSSVVKYKR